MGRTGYLSSPNEVANLLGVGGSTLRKWCLAIEAQCYYFGRTENQKRVFNEKDITVLKHFKHLVQVQNMSLENAAILVTSKYESPSSVETNIDSNVTEGRSPIQVLNTLVARLERLEKANEALVEHNKMMLEIIQEQRTLLEERLNDRDQLLLQSLRESQEVKKLMLESAEKQKRRGIMKFFGK